jgi:hypothetical protein
MTMAFALCPDDGPPRLWRFVDDDVMTKDRVVSILDSGQNILVINKPLYDQLAPMNQHNLLRTQRHLEYV